MRAGRDRMLFNSYEFIFLFLPITLIIFYAFCHYGKLRMAVWWLGFASLFFYAYWDFRFLSLFIASILVNFWIGHGIISSPHTQVKKRLLVFGLIVNLSLLVAFKYTHFLMENLLALAGMKGPVLDIILPVGISFFTFTQIAYLVDCMRTLKHQYHFSDYLLFVSFFPHLVAGPILRHDSVIPQIENKHFGRPSARKIYIAILFFSCGLFKKVVIADKLGVYVDVFFNHATQLNTLNAWTAALLYTFQIYFDFSAYSEMAIGLALLMNIRIPLNFNSPYKAKSMIDFWRRWHISLSEFLRDYLYIPLGGNQKGPFRRYINLFATMLLGGLWHGAAWTFMIWGGIHAICIAINHVWHKVGIELPIFFSWLLTFLMVVIAWVFFRAQSFNAAISLLKSMSGVSNNSTHPVADPFLGILSIILLIGWILVAPNTQQIAMKLPHKRIIAMGASIMLVVGILGLGQSENFIYFQF